MSLLLRSVLHTARHRVRARVPARRTGGGGRVCLVGCGRAGGGLRSGPTSPSARAATTTTTWFGPRVGADALANTRIGGPVGTTLAVRFRSTWSGSVSGVRFYVVVTLNGSVGEYSGGDGGTMRVSLVADGDNRLPSSAALASQEFHPRIDAISFPFIHFSTAPRVVAGRYHIVFTNTSPKPAENWVSVNALIAQSAGAAPPPLALARSVLLGDSTDGGATPTHWRVRAQNRGQNYLPIVDITGGEKGQHVGLGYMESWVSNPKPISGSAAVREVFTYQRPAAARVTQALVRLRRTGDQVGAAQRAARGSTREDTSRSGHPRRARAEQRRGVGVGHLSSPPIARPSSARATRSSRPPEPGPAGISGITQTAVTGTCSSRCACVCKVDGRAGRASIVTAVRPLHWSRFADKSVY